MSAVADHFLRGIRAKFADVELYRYQMHGYQNTGLEFLKANPDMAAEIEARSADQIVEVWRALPARLGASNDFFIRTSDAEHMAKVQEILGRIRDNGHVYEGVYEGWYCPRCADFKTDAEAGDDNLCPIHKTPLTREKEDNYFFRLSAFQDDLIKLLDEQPEFVMPRHRYNEARSFIESGLQDVSLSRPTFTRGTCDSSIARPICRVTTRAMMPSMSFAETIALIAAAGVTIGTNRRPPKNARYSGILMSLYRLYSSPAMIPSFRVMKKGSVGLR